MLGTLTTAQTGSLFQLELLSQHYFSASAADFVTARLIFSTANGAASILGNNSTPFYGAASCFTNGYAWDAASLAIQQFSSTSYGFFVFMQEYPGQGMFRITLDQAGDVFTYSGAVQTPTACWINPSADSRILKSDVGLGNCDNTSDMNKPVSTAVQTALNLKANLANPTITGTLTTANLTATGTVTIPNNSLTIARTSGLQTALDAKAPTANPVFTGTLMSSVQET